MEITKRKPDDYINSLPKDQKEIISAIDKAIRKAIPNEKPVMWEGKFWGGSDQKIIGYGEFIYTSASKKEVPWFMAGLTHQKNYVTLFMSGYSKEGYILEKYGKELGNVKVAKGNITFKKLEDVNLDKLAEVLKLAVTSREEYYKKNSK